MMVKEKHGKKIGLIRKSNRHKAESVCYSFLQSSRSTVTYKY